MLLDESQYDQRILRRLKEMLDPMDKEELENFLSKKYPLSNLNVHFDPKKIKKKKERERKSLGIVGAN